MSILFDAANDWAQNTGAPPVTAYPFTVSCWYKRADTSANEYCLAHFGQAASLLNAFFLMVMSTGHIEIRVNNGTDIRVATTTTAVNDTSWNHACGVFSGALSRSAYLNGGGKATSTSDRTPAVAPTMLRIGARTTDDRDMNGRIAHLAIWNVALSDADVAALAAGDNPQAVQGGNLVCYVETLASGAPGEDVIGSYDLTLAGNAAYDADNPTVDLYSAPGGGLAIPAMSARINTLLRM